MDTKFHQILLAEDDMDDRYVLHQAFEQLDYLDHVKFLHSGDELLKHLRYYRDASFSPSLIVLDYNMPMMNGGEVLIHIKRDTSLKDIPVVIYSTGMKPLLKDQLKALGAFRCYEKGFNYVNFYELAKEFMQIAEGDIAVEKDIVLS